MKNSKCAIIFGGTGFIGGFFANYLLIKKEVDKVYLLDIESLDDKSSAYRSKLIGNNSQIEIWLSDVRFPIVFNPCEEVFLIANFAAIHREPGHKNYEYFQTNILGAENVCDFAERVNCKNIIFTSSISPYGVNEEVRDEFYLPVPDTAYGSSKLVAEKIHQIWQARDQKNRVLTIVRPGVVFGPGEGGNVSRLIRAVIHRYFFYMGNKNTRKAGVYVKELCNAIWWMFKKQKKEKRNFVLFNITMNPGPSVQEYAETVCKIANIRRHIISAPYKFLLGIGYLIDGVAKPLGISHPFSPVRIKKLVRSNNILPTFLVSEAYQYKYTLESAFADWKKECPEEWK